MTPRPGARATRWLAVTVAAMLLWTAGHASPAQTGQAPATRVVISTDRDITNVDPVAISTPADYTIAYLVYSSLVRVKPGGKELEGDLAERWEVSSDGLVYTFYLRRRVQWHNNLGEVTADDVVAHYRRAADRQSGSLFFTDMGPVRNIEAVDRYTVRFTMSQPYPAFLTAVVAYRPGLIVPKRIIESNAASLRTTPVGSGPYVFANWRRGAEVTLSAHPRYYRGTPAIREVVMRIVQDDETALLALQRGEIDARYIQVPEVQKRVLEGRNLQVLRSPMPRTYYFAFNTTKPPFDDTRVRQALWYGLNRQAIVDRIFQGLGTVADTMLPPTIEGHLSTKVYNYSPDRARQLIQEARAEASLRERTYSILTLGLGDLQDIAAVAQDNWRAIGVNVRIESAETAVLLQRARAGNFDILGFAQLRTEPEQFLVSFFHSSNVGSTNYSRYDKIDKALDTFRLANNPRIRLRLIEEAQRQLQEDAPHIPVLNPTLVLVTTPRVRGAQLGLLIFNVWQWSLAR